MKKNNILSGAIILAVGSILAKLFSAIYRIVLTRILGGVGIGLYQLIFPIYSLLVVMATAGIPIAISKVVANNKGCEKTVVKKCMFFILVLSIVLSLALFCGSKWFATIQGETNLYICYMILAPTIVFVGMSSVLRGFFQGVKNFSASAVSNIVEQFVKMAVGLILTIIFIPYGIIYAIIGAIIGIVVSEVVSLLVLFIVYKKEIRNKKECNLDVSIKEIFKDILPISLTNLILPLSGFFDSLLVVNLLKINFKIAETV